MKTKLITSLAICTLTSTGILHASEWAGPLDAWAQWNVPEHWSPVGLPTFLADIGDRAMVMASSSTTLVATDLVLASDGDATLRVYNNSTTHGTLITSRTFVGTGPYFHSEQARGVLELYGTMESSNPLVLGHLSGGSGELLLGSSGKLISRGVAKGMGTAKVIFNGGTLQVHREDSENLFDGLRLGDVVFQSLGTIDTQAFTATCWWGFQGPGTLQKTGSGTLVLKGENTHARTIVKQGTLSLDAGSITHGPNNYAYVGNAPGDAGTMIVTNGARFKATACYLGGVHVTSSGVLKLAGVYSTLEGTLYIGDYGRGTFEMSSGVATNNSAFIGYRSGSVGSAELSGGTWNAYNVSMANLTGSSGLLKLKGGTLKTYNITRGSGAAGVLLDGGGIEITSGQSSFFYGFASGDVNIGPSGTWIDTKQYSSTIICSLAGAGGLVKSGIGTLTLTKQNTYAGETQVNQGNLWVKGGTGRVLLLSGTKLGGAGTVGSIVAREGSRVEPGTSWNGSNVPEASGLRCASLAGETGTFTLSHVVNQTSASRLVADGPVDLRQAQIELRCSALPPVGARFPIVEKSTTGAITPSVFVPEGHIVDSGTARFRFSYSGGDGNDLEITSLNTPPQLGQMADMKIACDGAPPPPMAISVSDAHTPAQDLVVSAESDNPALLPPGNLVLGGQGAARTLTLTPVPGQTGSATITVLVSDGDMTNSMSFFFTVSTFTELELWRETHFGTTANAGDAADDADIDRDGSVNLIEFAFGMDPKVPDAYMLPGAKLKEGALVFSFTPRPGTGGIIYGAETSPSLNPATWTPVPDTGVPPAREFRLPIGPGPSGFLKLSVKTVQPPPG